MGRGEDRSGSGRRLRSSALVSLACVGALLVLAGPVAGAVRGVVPGNFLYSLHEPVPLVDEPGFEEAEYRKFVDPRALFGAAAERRAGAHPDVSVGIVTRSGKLEEIFKGVNTTAEATIELPPGVLANFGEIPACPLDSFESTLLFFGRPNAVERCPAATQVGVVGALFGGELPERTYPLYKLEAPPGHLAALGFPYEILFERVPMVITVDPRADGDFGLDLTRKTVPNFNDFLPAPFMTIWGVPGDPVHNAERMNAKTWTWGAPLPAPHPPLIDSLAGCGAGTSEARLRLRYDDEAGQLSLPESSEDQAYRAFSPEQTGCESVPFEPGVQVEATSADSDSSTGLELRLHLPHAGAAAEAATSPPREATLALPAGMSLNPAAANGLAGCAAGAAPCPKASKLGTVSVDTPLTEAPLHGAVYLATPFENPFRSRWALYLVVDGPGFTVKLPARVGIEPDSGRLLVALDPLPQLPVEDVTIDLPGSPAAPLSTPAACGTGPAEVRLVPWWGPAQTIASGLRFEPRGAGEGCEAATPKPFMPALTAALADGRAANRSSLRIEIQRPAGDQTLKTIAASLPRGLVASLRYRPRCSEAEIAAALERSVAGGGALERAQASCPAASRVGSLATATGTGSAPLVLPGSLYLTGPYKGAPHGLVAITPVVAGGSGGKPLLDLGAVVDRMALRVDPRTAQITLESDPLPRSLDGIPLRIGAIAIDLDAPGFLRNPSGCEEKRVSAAVAGQEGAHAELTAGLRLAGCEALRFQPTLSLRSVGPNGVGAHPRLMATFGVPAGGAGIVSARLALPSSIGLDRARLDDACRPPTRPRASCPADSVVGEAEAWTPLADQPLAGPVRLVSSAGGPPGLAIELGGQLALELAGQIRSRGDSLQLAFPALPDVSLTRLAITIGSGGRGFFVNRRGLCARPGPVAGRFTAYNGKVARRTSALRADCQREE